MNISAEAAMLLPLFIAFGGFLGGLSYDAALAARHALWRAGQRR